MSSFEPQRHDNRNPIRCGGPTPTRPHAAHTLDLGLPGGSLNAFAGAIE